jgi:hypothetical protein
MKVPSLLLCCSDACFRFMVLLVEFSYFDVWQS